MAARPQTRRFPTRAAGMVLLGEAVLVVGALLLLPHVRFVGLATVTLVAGAAGLDLLRRCARLVAGPSRLLSRVCLMLVAILGGLFLCEVYLAIARPEFQLLGTDAALDPDMPAEWQQRKVPVEGARKAYTWHGHLHVQNSRGMRRVTPFPPRTPGVWRVLVLGDSLTYGLGVAEEQTYPAVLEQELRKGLEVEILNLGVSGHQREDVLEELRHFVPRLKPDQVLYGVYLNDFLPSRREEEAVAARDPRAPPGYFEVLRWRSRLIQITAVAWQKHRIRTGRENDALRNIQVDFEARQRRFLGDVRDMNTALAEHGLPPLLAYVMNHRPQKGSESNRLTLLAEELLKEAGAEVIPATPFLQRHDGQDLIVSRWETHPNAECHRAFAMEILPALRESLGGGPAPR